MKKLLLTAACVLALGIPAVADEQEDFVKWMKATAASAGSLRKNLAAKNSEGAAADSKKLQEVFKEVHDFWLNKKIDNATKFSTDAITGFKEVGDLATAGKFDEAQASLKKTMASCGGCHDAYREKAADGSYKLKY